MKRYLDEIEALIEYAECVYARLDRHDQQMIGKGEIEDERDNVKAERIGVGKR